MRTRFVLLLLGGSLGAASLLTQLHPGLLVRSAPREVLETRVDADPSPAVEEAEGRVQALGDALELAPEQREALRAVLLTELDRRTAVLASLRFAPDDPALRDQVQDELIALREWKRTALRDRLGPELARRVEDHERRNPGRLVADGEL